jgi:hypothetical protein
MPTSNDSQMVGGLHLSWVTISSRS